MPTTSAPAAHLLDAWLRARVLRLRESTTRRCFPASVELTPPAADRTAEAACAWCYGNASTDHALRVDVLVRLLTDCRCRGVRTTFMVHVRPGPHEPGDHDFAWGCAARAAAGVTGVAVPGVIALGRWGWSDLDTGAQRSWVRLRRRGADARQNPSGDDG